MGAPQEPLRAREVEVEAVALSLCPTFVGLVACFGCIGYLSARVAPRLVARILSFVDRERGRTPRFEDDLPSRSSGELTREMLLRAAWTFFLALDVAVTPFLLSLVNLSFCVDVGGTYAADRASAAR